MELENKFWHCVTRSIFFQVRMQRMAHFVTVRVERLDNEICGQTNLYEIIQAVLNEILCIFQNQSCIFKKEFQNPFQLFILDILIRHLQQASSFDESQFCYLSLLFQSLHLVKRLCKHFRNTFLNVYQFNMLLLSLQCRKLRRHRFFHSIISRTRQRIFLKISSSQGEIFFWSFSDTLASFIN